MNEDLGRAGCFAAWVVFALCALSACAAAPGSAAPASAGEHPGSVVEAVRLATDRSALRQDVVTLPSGERMRRMTFGSGVNHVLIGRRGADGKPMISCVNSAPAAEAFLAGGSAGAGQ